MGTNIGKVGLKVYIRDRSPFSAQAKQEAVHYFTYDNFSQMESYDCSPLPNPINGVRNKESLQNYDNFLEDVDGYLLGKSYYNGTATVSTDKGNKTVTTTTASDGGAAVRENNAENKGGAAAPAPAGAGAQAANQTPAQASVQLAAQRSSKLSSDQKDFFTWKITGNIFKPDANNLAARKFTEPPQNDAAAEFTYITPTIPGGNATNLILMPAMRKSPPDKAKPIHWGVNMKTALAKNQPFEIIYQFNSRDPAIAENAPVLTPRFDFVDFNGKPMDLKLAKSVYVAIEIGIGNSRDHFMLLFVNNQEPMFFQAGGSPGTPQFILRAKFNGAIFNFSKLFDPNHKYFTVKVEPVLGSFIVRSNVFSDTPWIILAPLNDPIFIGQGPLGLYGGNVQAGFLMRPVQYVGQGQFFSPETSYQLLTGGGPNCSAATKGSGEIEQDRAYSGDGEPLKVPVVNMVDAEEVNGSNAKTILEAAFPGAGSGITTSRQIEIEAEQVENSDTDPAAQAAEGGSADETEKTFRVKVTMTSGNVTQGNGYVVKNGRSPYIWMVRCEVAPEPGRNPQDLIDISCDVMSVELTWNATSYNELNHTCTMRVLNRREPTLDNPRPVTDYRNYINRAVYIRIEAWWQHPGAGHDPGPDQRQVFEGLTVGAEVTTKAENEIVTFRCEDYMNALQGSKFVLCPFYDGMKASLAVRDIVTQMGMPDNRIMADDVPIIRANLSQDLGLPFSNPLEEPLFRFKDGTSYKEGIMNIAKMDFKCVYFDRFGRFHYDTMPGGLFVNKAFAIKEKFWSSQITAASSGDVITPDKLKKIVWNSISFSRLINDVYNVIQVSSVTKRLQAKISVGSAYKAGIFDPNAEGYLGYRKHLMIAEPALGSIDAVGRYIENYRRRVFIPPLTAKFETYGYTGLQPLDIIELDGQKLRILNISSRISAAENIYLMNIEGEWFFSAGKDEDPALVNEGEGVTPSYPESPGEQSTV